MDHCRADELAATLSTLDGATVSDGNGCHEPVTHEVLLKRRVSPGHGLDLWARVCDAHEQLIGLSVHHARSIRLRPPN
jgi:hypothetical protein